MTAESNARAMLRAATADCHERVDAIFSRADLADRDGYGRFLLSQADAFLPIERALDRDGIEQVVPDWAARKRAPALLADLAALGLEGPAGEGEMIFATEPALLGALYVLDGSRLGGALLKRSVSPELPTTFLSAHDSAAWRGLLQIIDDRIRTDADRRAATEAARGVFAAFEVSGQYYLKVE